MSATADTVHDRLALARAELDPTGWAAILLLASGLGFGLLVLQEPLVHDALHNFRHAAGVTCH